MRRAWLLLLLALASPGAAGAETGCPSPDDLTLHDVVLDRVRAAVAARNSIAILAIGGSSTTGAVAGGEAYSYTTRLAIRLREALPGVGVRMDVRPAIHHSARNIVERMGGDLAETHPDLVIWGVGGLEAGRHVDIDSFTATLERGIAKAHDAGADMIIMDVLYAPSIARIIDLTPYRNATAAAASANGAAMLDRHDLMRRWSEAGVFDLDATSPEVRVATARRLFDCFATILADGITAAVRRQ